MTRNDFLMFALDKLASLNGKDGICSLRTEKYEGLDFYQVIISGQHSSAAFEVTDDKLTEWSSEYETEMIESIQWCYDVANGRYRD